MLHSLEYLCHPPYLAEQVIPNTTLLSVLGDPTLALTPVFEAHAWPPLTYL